MRVITITFVDASLLHDIVTGKSVTSCIALCQHHPNRLVFEETNIVETATYGSEFVAVKTATEQIMDLRNILRYLGVPIMT